MDRLTRHEAFYRAVDEEVRRTGVSREDAETSVAIRMGGLEGDGDLLFIPPLDDEERKRLGIGRSIFDVIAEEEALRQTDAASTRLEDDLARIVDVLPAKVAD